MEEKKTSVLALLEILKEYTDEYHVLTQPELLNLLDTIYHVSLDRRTLYKNVQMLQDFGYEISTFSDNGKGYYLDARQFEPSQVNLLCNAIHSSNLIPTNSSKELINKLLNTQSKYFKNDYHSTVFIENKDKKENKEFFLNIDLISEAIKDRKVISFNYTKYDISKKLVNKREEPYIISPYYLIYSNEKTYLIGKSNHYNDLTHFRVDKIKNVKTTDDNFIKVTKNEDPYEYAKSMTYMYHGDIKKIAIRCDYSILDDVIDKFGKDITIIEHDKDHFDAYVKSTKQGMVFIALQYINYMEVLEPKDVRDDIKQALKEGAKKYK